MVQGLKTDSFKKIVIVTGAGISVSAGIPDFRSSGGLYEELGKKHGCSTPEELMTLSKFMSNPEILYSIMHEFMKHEVRNSFPNFKFNEVRFYLQTRTTSSHFSNPRVFSANISPKISMV